MEDSIPTKASAVPKKPRKVLVLCKAAGFEEEVRETARRASAPTATARRVSVPTAATPGTVVPAV